jgi:hypothetical protein
LSVARALGSSTEIKSRVLERPDAFRKFASLDDDTIDRLLGVIAGAEGGEGP